MKKTERDADRWERLYCVVLPELTYAASWFVGRDARDAILDLYDNALSLKQEVNLLRDAATERDVHKIYEEMEGKI